MDHLHDEAPVCTSKSGFHSVFSFISTFVNPVKLKCKKSLTRKKNPEGFG